MNKRKNIIFSNLFYIQIVIVWKDSVSMLIIYFYFESYHKQNMFLNLSHFLLLLILYIYIYEQLFYYFNNINNIYS